MSTFHFISPHLGPYVSDRISFVHIPDISTHKVSLDLGNYQHIGMLMDQEAQAEEKPSTDRAGFGICFEPVGFIAGLIIWPNYQMG